LLRSLRFSPGRFPIDPAGVKEHPFCISLIPLD
jgi:hypothetical protein